MSKSATQALIFTIIGVIAAEVILNKTPAGALLK